MINSEAFRKVILVGACFVAVMLAGISVLSYAADDDELPKDVEVSKIATEEAARISDLDYIDGDDFSGDGYRGYEVNGTKVYSDISSGKIRGVLPDGSFVQEFAAWGYTVPVDDGTYGWYFELPPDVYTKTLTGRAVGTFRMSVGAGVPGQVLAYGDQPIALGEQADIALDFYNREAPLIMPDGSQVLPDVGLTTPEDTNADATTQFDFDDGQAQGWTDDGSGLWSISNGVYTMAGDGGDLLRNSHYQEELANFSFQADVRKVSGDGNGPVYGYGLHVRSDGTQKNYYEFNILYDGRFMIGKSVDWDFSKPVDWTTSKELRVGYNQWNTLKVVARGSVLEFYANGALLATIEDSTFSSGKVGFFAVDAATSQESDTIQFDNVFISEFVDDVTDPVAERTLKITSTEAAPGDSITVQISITDAAGMAGGDILVKYDPAIITIDDVRSTALTADMGLTPSTNTAGEIRLAMTSGQGLPSGSGALVDIDMTINSNAQTDTETTLSFGDTEIWDDLAQVIPINVENGVIKINQPGLKGDVNKDGRVRSNDATLTLRIVAQLMIPDDYQTWAADMNGDGRVRSNDAALILRKAAGLVAPGANVIASVGRQITVALSEARGVAGESITVPVWINNAGMLASGYMSVAYDSSVLRATGISSDSDALMVSNTSEPGILHVAFAGTGAMNARTLAKIHFNILADDISPLILKNVELYGPDALPLTMRHLNSEFRSWAMPPENSALLQNFPNPFNPETWIPYQLKAESEITIRIYETSGKLVRELDLGHKSAGVYISRDRAAYWDGKDKFGIDMASGLYFVTIKAGDFASVRKMTLLK